jgi:DNA-binding PadR family transcriptional regulator
MSYLLGVHVSSLNEFLAKLEKNGYVVREQSPEDKRVILVRLTDKGRVEEDAPDVPDTGLDCLTEDERGTLRASLDKVIAALQTELGIDGDEFDERMRAAREHHRFHKFHGHRRGSGTGCGHDHKCGNDDPEGEK